jgi:hypothetical protein
VVWAWVEWAVVWEVGDGVWEEWEEVGDIDIILSLFY